jgi:hypothetical protein
MSEMRLKEVVTEPAVISATAVIPTSSRITFREDASSYIVRKEVELKHRDVIAEV